MGSDMPNKKKPDAGKQPGKRSDTRAQKSAPEKRRKTSGRGAGAQSTEERMLADLKRSGIASQHAKALGFKPLESDEVYALCGQRRTAYLIPYPDHEGNLTGFYRLRFTEEAKEFGKVNPRKSYRYWQPPYTLPRFYLAPGVEWPSIAADTSRQVTFTEGEKKAAIACQKGIHTIGLGGVWSWRSKKHGADTGRPELSDFRIFRWKDRVVEVAYDSDIRDKRDVQRALVALASYLLKLGVAEMLAVDLPPGYDLDSYLAEHGVKAYQKLPRQQVNAIPEWVQELNQQYFVALDGNKMWVCEEHWDGALERFVLAHITFDDFKKRYMNEWVYYSDDAKPKRKGDAWLEHEHRRQYDRISMSPSGDIPGHYNRWRGFAVEPEPGCCEKFKAHVLQNICRGNKGHFTYLWKWVASAVQHPDKPGEVAVVLKGKQGTGKGVFARTIGSLFGQHFVHISKGESLTGRFNSHLRDAILVFADEAVFAGDKKNHGTLKAWITEPTIQTEKKFQDATATRNMIHLIMASNERWVVSADMEERRFFVLEVADTHMQEREYFNPIYRELDEGGLAALLYELLQTNLSDFDVTAVPQTDALIEQKLRSLDPVDSWWYRILCAGQLPGTTGWGKATTAALHASYSDFATQHGHGRYCEDEVSFGKSLSALLPKGWPQNKRLKPKGSKHSSTAARQPTKIFPPLTECRDYFIALARLRPNHDWEG